PTVFYKTCGLGIVLIFFLLNAGWGISQEISAVIDHRNSVFQFVLFVEISEIKANIKPADLAGSWAAYWFGNANVVFRVSHRTVHDHGGGRRQNQEIGSEPVRIPGYFGIAGQV